MGTCYAVLDSNATVLVSHLSGVDRSTSVIYCHHTCTRATIVSRAADMRAERIACN